MNIAVLYIAETIASTVYDHLNAFQKHGKYNYIYLDILKVNITLDYINQFEFIIIHYTISIFNDDRCPAWLRMILRMTRAKKIVFIQDEYRLINDVIENLNFIKADLLYTCVPKTEIEKVYPKEKLPNLIKINTLTGFIPKHLLLNSRLSYEDRKIDVVYRARKLSAWYGSLGREKWIIAERFSKDAELYGLITDISYKEKDRIYGENWINFLQLSKAAIGCESGASVFDFTGNIQRKVERYEKLNPHASFEEIEEKFFKGIDGQIKLNQISPRCFECAALGTLMILYEGEYSKILKPWRHYVPLKKDHSNMDEVVSIIKSPEKWKEITNYAYQEVAINKEYSCEYFIQKFEDNLNQIFEVSALATKKNINLSDLLNYESSFEKKPIKIRFLLVLKKILCKLIGEKYTEILMLFKRRIMLSICTLQSLMQDNNKNYYNYMYIFKKDFYDEYNFIKNIQNYAACIKKSMGYLPIEIKKSIFDEYVILIYPNTISTNNTDNGLKFLDSSIFIKQPRKIIIKVEDNWGIPKNIRGIIHTLKYPTILNNGNL